jgi:hypothetical protein
MAVTQSVGTIKNSFQKKNVIIGPIKLGKIFYARQGTMEYELDEAQKREQEALTQKQAALAEKQIALSREQAALAELKRLKQVGEPNLRSAQARSMRLLTSETSYLAQRI